MFANIKNNINKLSQLSLFPNSSDKVSLISKQPIKNKKFKEYDINLIEDWKIQKSLKNKLTYWIKVKNTWKRTAKLYYFFLIELGVINTNLDTNVEKFIKNKNLDCFYTVPENVNLCMQIYSNYYNINKHADVIIEPSAGNGAFINNIQAACNNTIFLDVNPEHSLILKQDFLTFNINLNKYKHIHVIGNPPFSLNKKFIVKACSIADSVGFILPLSFVKDSRKKWFPLNFHCVKEHVLVQKKFSFCNSWHKVPTVFQIWEKRLYNRPPIIRLVSANFKFVKKEDKPDLAFSRVGKAGHISFSNIELKSKNTHYFIKLENGFSLDKFMAAFKKIKFPHNNTVAQKSISQQELLFELKKYGV